jgi:hypothetical protein
VAPATDTLVATPAASVGAPWMLAALVGAFSLTFIGALAYATRRVRD